MVAAVSQLWRWSVPACSYGSCRSSPAADRGRCTGPGPSSPSCGPAANRSPRSSGYWRWLRKQGCATSQRTIDRATHLQILLNREHNHGIRLEKHRLRRAKHGTLRARKRADSQGRGSEDSALASPRTQIFSRMLNTKLSCGLMPVQQLRIARRKHFPGAWQQQMQEHRSRFLRQPRRT